ncbi:MAG: T9SS type A sorting domain-containing protein [Bacteroidales bacterium]|nr:T9SS type A sorting domain-containing protein [Bacteroidales bacterium]
MKTKNLLMVALLALAALGLKAQEYEPVLQEGNEWHTLYVMVAGYPTPEKYNTFVNWISGDTLVEGVRYSKTMETVNEEDNPYLVALLREEEGKLWGRKRQYGFQTEMLLYDFNVSVGDTLRFGDFAEFEYWVVDSVSFEQIGGRERKKIWFGMDYLPRGETWTEGIGSDLGLLYSGWTSAMGGYTRALCFHHDGDLVWQNPEYDACLITTIEEAEMQKANIYPNPTTGFFAIEGSVKTLAVFNSLGHEMYSGTTSAIDVRDWPKGVYFVHITGKDGEVSIKKLVKQ